MANAQSSPLVRASQDGYQKDEIQIYHRMKIRQLCCKAFLANIRKQKENLKNIPHDKS